jgi:hypothetical protein
VVEAGLGPSGRRVAAGHEGLVARGSGGDRSEDAAGDRQAHEQLLDLIALGAADVHGGDQERAPLDRQLGHGERVLGERDAKPDHREQADERQPHAPRGR